MKPILTFVHSHDFSGPVSSLVTAGARADDPLTLACRLFSFSSTVSSCGPMSSSSESSTATLWRFWGGDEVDADGADADMIRTEVDAG